MGRVSFESKGITNKRSSWAINSMFIAFISSFQSCVILPSSSPSNIVEYAVEQLNNMNIITNKSTIGTTDIFCILSTKVFAVHCILFCHCSIKYYIFFFLVVDSLSHDSIQILNVIGYFRVFLELILSVEKSYI